MSDGRRSFWSSIPGLITGLAGLLTGVVGLGTLAVQQGIVGGTGSATTTTAVAPGSPTTTTVESGVFTVTPSPVKFQAGQREATVTVANAGKTGITVKPPEFSPVGVSVFRTDTGCSNVTVRRGRSCELKIFYTPSGLLKAATAKLVITADGVPGATEVLIETSAL